MESIYNVYVIKIGEFKAVEQAGENLIATQATNQVRAVEHRVDLSEYFVDAYEVDSERDLECKEDLNEK